MVRVWMLEPCDLGLKSTSLLPNWGTRCVSPPSITVPGAVLSTGVRDAVPAWTEKLLNLLQPQFPHL